MGRIAATCLAGLGTLAVLGAARPVLGQSNVKVVLQEVVDDRISEGMMKGGLVVVLGLSGDGLDAVKAARFRLREAKDDTGRDLLDPKQSAPGFTDRNVNAGRVQVVLGSPPREATNVRLSGTAELFVPGRDPASVVKVPGFLARPDQAVASRGLKAAKVDLTVLSKAKYVEARQQSRLDEEKIALIRAEGKARGMGDDELEALIEMAKAFDELGEGDLPQHGLYLRVPKASDEKIQELWVENAAGERLDTAGSSSRSDEAFVLKQVGFREALPKDAVLVLSLFTDKSIVTVPFELKEVPLP